MVLTLDVPDEIARALAGAGHADPQRFACIGSQFARDAYGSKYRHPALAKSEAETGSAVALGYRSATRAVVKSLGKSKRAVGRELARAR